MNFILQKHLWQAVWKKENPQNRLIKACCVKKMNFVMKTEMFYSSLNPFFLQIGGGPLQVRGGEPPPASGGRAFQVSAGAIPNGFGSIQGAVYGPLQTAPSIRGCHSEFAGSVM